MQKSKQKRTKQLKPKEQEVFRRVLCNIEIMRVLYEESVELNKSLIDDICHATERIEKLEYALIKGMICGALIVGIVWIISLI
jgi:hypothetical protein